jgi:hypothetical protein
MVDNNVSFDVRGSSFVVRATGQRNVERRTANGER